MTKSFQSDADSRNLLSRQNILMCAADHFDVSYIINPWMEHQIGKSAHTLALGEWLNLRQHIEKKVPVSLIKPQPGLPDMVFTANAGFVLQNTAVVSRFRMLERQPEEPFFCGWFKEHGFSIAPWPQDVRFEGAGDALLDRGQPIIWCGHGFRTDAAAPALLEKVFGRRTIGLRLIDPRFYHLDTCFCPLSGGWLLYYPPAFDAPSRELITSLQPPHKNIEVGEEDALLFACNAVDVAGNVFLNAASDSLQARLRAAGFEPVVTPLGEFIKAGGGAKCLTLKLVEMG
ncbi:MAG TPA: arginine deiminase-related protein [Methylocella sp.]|nr:arginine deiminase-related protein [Methylocella sp.]